jgi:hypothetical protein
MHTQPVGRLCTSDQLVVEAATYTTHNKHKRRMCVTFEGVEPAIPAFERRQTYTLNCTASGIDAKDEGIRSKCYERPVYELINR